MIMQTPIFSSYQTEHILPWFIIFITLLLKKKNIQHQPRLSVVEALSIADLVIFTSRYCKMKLLILYYYNSINVRVGSFYSSIHYLTNCRVDGPLPVHSGMLMPSVCDMHFQELYYGWILFPICVMNAACICSKKEFHSHTHPGKRSKIVNSKKSKTWAKQSKGEVVQTDRSRQDSNHRPENRNQNRSRNSDVGGCNKGTAIVVMTKLG